MKKLLQKIVKKLDDSKFAKKVHGKAGVIWLASSVPICIWLNSSIPLLVFISVYAIVVGHWSGWDAAGAEVEIEKLHKRVNVLIKKVDKVLENQK